MVRQNMLNKETELMNPQCQFNEATNVCSQTEEYMFTENTSLGDGLESVPCGLGVRPLRTGSPSLADYCGTTGFLRRMTMLLLLLVMSSVLNTAWARDFIFHVVNNTNGSISLSQKVTINDASLGNDIVIPTDMRSPLIRYVSDADNDFSYYADLAKESSVTKYEDITVDGSGNYVIYVGYTFTPATTDEIDVTGNTWYTIKSTDWWGYAMTNGTKLEARKTSTAYADAEEADKDRYLWKFTGNDPYYITINNKYADFNLGRTNATLNSSSDWAIFVDINYDASFGVKAQQPFVYLKQSGTAYFCAADYCESETKNYWFLGLKPGDSNQRMAIYRNDKANGPLCDRPGWCGLTVTSIYELTMHVITPLTNTDLKSSIAPADLSANFSIPESLKRKYITKYKPYYLDGEGTKHYLTEITKTGTSTYESTDTYQTLKDLGIKDVYLEYEYASMPFTACTDYEDALTNDLWVNLMVDSGHLYFKSDSKQFWGGDAGTNTDKLQDRRLFAFIGDPYELRIICKSLGSDYYLGVPAGSSSGTDITYGDDVNAGIIDWEIMVDSTGVSGNNQLALRQRGTYGAARYFEMKNGSNKNQIQILSAYYYTGAPNRVTINAKPAAYSLAFNVRHPETKEYLASMSTYYFGSDAAVTVAVPDAMKRPFATDYAMYTTYLPDFSGTPSATFDPANHTNMLVYVTYTLNDTNMEGNHLFSTDVEHATWYYLKSGENYLRVTGSDNAPTTVSSLPSQTNVDEFMFAVVGNPYNYTIYRKDGENYIRLTNTTTNDFDSFELYRERANVKYVIIDNSGTVALSHTTLSSTLLLPGCIESPLASNYRYYTTQAMAVGDLEANRITLSEQATETDGDAKVVYVRYSTSPAYSLLTAGNFVQMTFAAQSSRVLGIANSLVTNRDHQVYGSDGYYWKYYQNSWLWYLDGKDPYNFTIRNYYDNSYIAKSSSASGQPVTTTTTATDAAHLIMLFNDYSNAAGMSLLLRPATNEDNYMLMEGNSTPPVFTTTGTTDLSTLLTTARNNNYSVVFPEVTYIVVSHDGSIATMATASGTVGDSPSMPTSITSPLATNFRYYTSLIDAQNDDGTVAYISAHAVTTIPAKNISFFVRYDNNLAGTDFDLSGDLTHHIIHNSTGKYVVTPTTGNGHSSNQLLYAMTEEDAKADINCSWTITGNDPYNAKIYSVSAPTKNIRIEDPSKQNDRNIAICGTSEDKFWSNYCPLDRFIILSGSVSGTYRLMESTNSRNNERFYARDNTAEIKFQKTDNPDNNYNFRFVSPFKRDVTFHIIDRNGREAISATHEWHTDKTLPTVAVEGGAIPTEIYSPYLDGETLTWYGGYDAVAKSVTGDPITRMDNSASDVYVTYTTDHLSEKPLHFAGARGFEMKVNGHYVYDDSGTLQHTSLDTDKDKKEHLWNTIGNDPYAIQIRNVGTPTRFFNWSISPTQSITLGSGSGDNTYFIAMKRTDNTENMVTELMAATGANLSSSDYYSIGRLAEGAPTMLRSDSYPHDDAAIQIILTPAHFDVTYRVIDKQNKIVLEVPATEIDLGLPEAWKSPLVPENGYHYWIKDRFNISGDIYELNSGMTTANEAVGISESTDGYIYVTYDVITDASDPNFIDLNSAVDYTERVSRSTTDNTQVRNAGKFGIMYMLQFTSIGAYKLENGDYEDEATTASGTKVYPYTNGDGPIYVYTDAKWESQKNGGASTRTRWPWYLLSQNNDPYHVMVTSWQNSHANNGTNYYSFLRTFYNETLGSVVTNNVTDDPRTLDDDDNQILPTEYMLLNGNGTTGKFMLRTTEEINGTHEPVTSFEQYWRNNPTVHRTLGLAEGSGPITDTQKQTLRDGHEWHNYDYYAYAAAWTGGTGSSNKSYAKEEHWFMTVNVGDGSFNIVPTEIDAVLVLLDNHGWEIMRQNIAKHSEPAKYAAAQTALRKYDSPMVSQYKFYGTRNVDHKVSGYHKYNIENGASKALKYADRVEETTTFTSLADYPEKYNGGALLDLYVTYDVKPQYAEAYTGAETKAETSVNKAFIIRQDGKLAKTTDGTTLSTIDASTTGIDAGTTDELDDQDLYWYLKPNFDIDTEMGYLYDVDVNGKKEGIIIDRIQTDANYTTNNQDGFDPYNIQILNKNHGGYFTTDATGASVVNHRYLEGTYPSTPGTLSLVSEPSAQFNPVITDYDSKELHITNATFMAVQDANGNMRLMPRFDHSRVITDFATIETQHNARPEDDKVDGQSTMLLRPTIYTYIIVDNSGREALRFTSLSSGAPSTPVQYKSPLATSFKYYKTLAASGSDYDLSTLGDEIAGSFAEAGMNEGGTVYVRYDYNRDGDTQGLLQGMWLTMQLNSNGRQYSGGNVTTGTTDATQSAWQWRLLQKAADDPDPYSVNLYSATNMGAPISINSQNRFAILRFNNEINTYALAVAGTKSTDSYTFVNGSAANATTADEAAAFKNSGTIVDANKVQFTANVNPTTVTYRLVTNLKHIALTGDASATMDYVPSMPQWMRSPLMKNEDATYQYYAGATASGTEYTVNNPTKTLRNLDIEDGKSVVYVRYDYETSKQAAAYNSGDTKAVLNLDGSVPYRFALNTYQAVKVKDNNTVDVCATGNGLLMHDARSLWYFTGNDPYEFKISNYYDESKFISAQDVAEGTGTERKPVKMLADVDDTYKFNTFMILKAPGENNSSPEKALTCYVSGSQRIFLIEYGLERELRVYKHNKDYSECYKDGDKISAGNNVEQKHFRFVPAMAYHVITNSGQEAIVAASDFTGFETVTIPNAIHSPLLNKSDFRYYTHINTDDSGTMTVDPDSEIADNTSIYDHVAKGEGDIYIRYTYDRDNSPRQFLDGYDKTTTHGLDLGGSTWYTMVECGNLSSNKPVYNKIIYALNDMAIRHNKSFDADPSKLMTSDGWKLSDKRLLWCLEGNDPYAIRIRNAHKGKSIYATGNNSNENVYFIQEGNETGEEYTTFMYLTFASEGEKDVAKEDIGATFVPTGHWNDDRCFNTQSGDQLKMFKWGDNTLVSRLGADNFNNEKNSYNCWISFYKAPAGRKYHYHAYNTTLGEWTWDATLEHDFLTPVVLEDEIARLYCKYEPEYLTSSGDHSTFKTRAELEALNNAQFYSNEAMTERVYDTNSNTYDVYPEIEENEVRDIYFKYQVDNEATDINGKTLSELTSSPAQISSDVDTYTSKGKLDSDTKQANWWFMVLDTDYDLTRTVDGSGNKTYTGKQQFLRREDNGNVGWMNNDYALHYLNEDNYNGWSYHRIAEWYRNGDNDAFREGRWLWTFMGDDPYNMQVLNMESVVGVQAKGEGVYELKAANDCWATISKQETKDNNGNVTSTYYPVRIPTDKPEENYNWGLVDGNNSDGTLKLLSTAMTTELDGKTVNLAHYWQMENDSVVGHSVSGTQAIRLLEYVPVIYQDVNLVIKRDDHVTDYNGWKAGKTDDQKRERLLGYDSGLSLLYFTADERAYAAGDRIDMSSEASLPINVRRAFCTYKLYSDDYDTEGGTYIVTDGPYPDKSVQATTKGAWVDSGDGNQIYNPEAGGTGFAVTDEDGRPVYPYYTIDEGGHKVGAPGGAQSLYVQYTVTSDIFLKEAPTKAEVETMYDNNDHVYFMDFPGESTNVHHAFFDREAKTRIQTNDLSKKIDKNLGTWKTEKKKASGTNTFVDDTDEPYNHLQFRTTENRMYSIPEHLKWYFVGDPYKVQVFNTYPGDTGNKMWNTDEITDTKGTVWLANTKAANLARFNPVETNFQFVVDCVHMRLPDYSNKDTRAELTPTDSLGHALDPIPNRNVNKPYYDDFYWECVPAASDEEGTFALRFKEDNDLLGYRNVYYYLAHDGLTRTYRSAEDQPEVYHINLNYRADNERYNNGKYLGYHKANDKNTVIRLVQPVKLYVSASRTADDTGRTAQANVTTDEVSEYFGLGETVTEVPRHLQRKFVSYDWTNFALIDANKYSNATCTDHTSNVFVSPTEVNYVFKRGVNYTVNDLTTDGDTQVHLFSTCANPAAPTANELQWLDVMIGNNNWLYYDKLNENQTSLVSNYRRAMSTNKKGWNNDVDGWNDGLKGLHWAFIGDPYDFTVINRRRFEDGNGTGNQWLTNSSTSPYGLTMTTTAADDATHYSTRMWKVGDADKYVMTTAEGNQESETSPTLKRMIAQNSTTEFRLMSYSLLDRRNYTSNENDLTYNNYVNNGYSYSKTLNGLGGMQQLLQIRTAVAKDEDEADNDCFDSEVRIYTTNHVQRIKKTGMEIKYGKADESLPYSLRRYGCTYTCYLVTDNDSVLVSDFDSTTKLTSSDDNVNGKTFRQFIDSKTSFRLSYVYEVEDEASQFFTTKSDAMTDDYTWMNTYFAWNQTYFGTNVEVEYYVDVFDHYVYNSAGQIIDEVYIKERRTRVVSNPTEAYPTTAYLNSHTNQTNIYADEGTQSESDRQKWSLVGDPYEFTMKNYAQYLEKATATLKLDDEDVVNTTISKDAQNFAIALDKDGKPYLAVINNNGEATTLISFTFDSSSDKRLQKTGTGTNQNDPTGNSLDSKNAKPFMLANLIRYADILQYHLVIAHQHSLDPEESYLQYLKSEDTGSETEIANRKTLREHLLEYLKYQEIRKNLTGANKYLNGSSAISGDGTEWIDAKVTDIKALLKTNGTLRDFLSYPIADYSVSRVGIGNHPQVPWYMKRQFCRYYLYQKDVMRSVTLNGSFDYNKNGVVGDVGDIVLAYKKDEQGNYLDANGNITTDPSKYVQLFMDEAKTKPAYEIMWVSVDDRDYWDVWNSDEDGDPETGSNKERAKKIGDKWYKIPKYYNEAMALNGKVLDKLQECHFNRKVLIDVVYEVIPEEFRFADKGRNTTAWYQMMTNNEDDGLMNFTYKDGIGARLDRTEHYTNNYLWAPEGDPYGFVLRSRYATINGTGWDNVAVTTKGHLPKSATDPAETDYTASEIAAGNISKFQANYTDHTQFDDHRIIHKLTGDDGGAVTTDGPTNAVYEMFTGDINFENSFLMHPTSAYLDNTDSDFESYYMKHFINKTDPANPVHTTKLTYTSGRTLQTDADANWSLRATAEQLWPYFKYAGYVGGMNPAKATEFTNMGYYIQLKNAIEGGSQLDFNTMRKIQEVVYSGTFKTKSGTTLNDTDPRPGSDRTGALDATELPLTFISDNLVNMTDGYYRIVAFSEEPLNTDGKDLAGDGSNIQGIIGPRYISGYRFESEKTDPDDSNNNGGRWLHFLETDMSHSTIHTYADLLAKISEVDTRKEGGTSDRDQISHPAMKGNIEILSADFDPSSIFKFAGMTATNGYEVYNVGTQGLQLWARPGGTEGLTDAHKFGRTELVKTAPSSDEAYSTEEPRGWSNQFRMADIGGAAMTLRTLKQNTGNWDADVVENLKTNYVCIDRNHRYRITCHTDNEMVEIGDHYTNDGINGIQDTKWRLQPVGIHEDWPYNEMPLRVEVNKGGVRNSKLEDPDLSALSNEDNNYYGSLYVPFDVRLGNTTDAAFTLTATSVTDGTTAEPGTITLASVSRLNEMGNPQFVPANWPVVLRTSIDKHIALKNGDDTPYATKHYVNLYIPNVEPTTITGAIESIQLKGEYLEKTLTTDKTIMVFGLPFEGLDSHSSHEYEKKQQVGFFRNDNWARENAPTKKAHKGSYPNIGENDLVASDGERDNKYVYHNKIYYPYSTSSTARSVIRVFFEGDVRSGGSFGEEDEPIEDGITDQGQNPWPCDVFELQGRRVGRNETPETLRKNHPNLPPGIYIFGGKKVVVH